MLLRYGIESLIRYSAFSWYSLRTLHGDSANFSSEKSSVISIIFIQNILLPGIWGCSSEQFCRPNRES